MLKQSMRLVTSALLIGGLAACVSPAAQQGGGPSVTITRAANDPGTEAGFQDWVRRFRVQALASGISPATYDRAMATTHYKRDVVRLDRRQSEFTKTIWQYLDGAVSDSRITTGRQMASRYASTLAQIEGRYGVPREIVLAVWGMETNFGANRGGTRIIPALATLAYDGRRGAFFGEQLIAALKIIQAGDVDADHMVGSWAGAMGHTQFMPTSYLEHAVDFNGDGRRDIWSDDPTDALASTAAYLARSGWQRGVPWAVEVQLPANFDFHQAGKKTQKSASAWQASGVRAFGGGALPNVSGSILVPAGARGPAFLITQNFRTISDYNASDSYVLGVGTLANRIAGRPGIQGAWPRGDRALSSAEKTSIQRILTSKGYDTGGIDGKLGSQSVEAIRAFQKSRGVAPDGYADQTLIGLLRN